MIKPVDIVILICMYFGAQWFDSHTLSNQKDSTCNKQIFILHLCVMN